MCVCVTCVCVCTEMQDIFRYFSLAGYFTMSASCFEIKM